MHTAEPQGANLNRVLGAGLPRWIEVPLALAGLMLVCPILALASLFIVLTSSGPVLFRQKRVGRGGKEFVMYKLRSMRQANSGALYTAAGDPRVTPVGRVLRKLKLDELPELWNVVRGEMSLVGPRPELPQYVNLEDSLWQFIVQARPGLTDPVTLRLRNEEQLLAKVDGDRERFYREELQPYKLLGYVEYLESRNWGTDLRLLLETAVAAAWPASTQLPTREQISEYVRNNSMRHFEDGPKAECQLQ